MMKEIKRPLAHLAHLSPLSPKVVANGHYDAAILAHADLRGRQRGRRPLAMSLSAQAEG